MQYILKIFNNNNYFNWCDWYFLWRPITTDNTVLSIRHHKSCCVSDDHDIILASFMYGLFCATIFAEKLLRFKLRTAKVV